MARGRLEKKAIRSTAEKKDLEYSTAPNGYMEENGITGVLLKSRDSPKEGRET